MCICCGFTATDAHGGDVLGGKIVSREGSCDRLRIDKRFRIVCGGFTLVEVIAVLVIVSILSIGAIVYYGSLLKQSKIRSAQNLISAASTQLSLDFARRTLSGLALDVDSQPICNWVVIGTSSVPATVNCTGSLDGDVVIDAEIDGEHVSGQWRSPVSNSF